MKKYYISATVTAFVMVVVFTFSLMANAQGYSFSNDLSVGASGGDVSNLQTWLINNGFDIPAVSAGITSKGFFGSQTKSALMRYQTSIQLPSFGFFGPLTRARLNGWSNNSNAFNVISPNGGEVWVKGTTQTIKWNTPSFLRATFVDIKLVPYQAPCPTGYVCAMDSMMIRAPYTLATGVSIDQRSFNWNIDTSIHDGSYTIQICQVGTSNCVVSHSTFTVTSNSVSTGNAPVISGIDAPTTLAVGATGTWTVHASDPLNQQLNYVVNWGDVATAAGTDFVTASPSSPSVQTTTFTHSYAQAGNYTVTFTVKNFAGLSTVSTATVNVGSVSTVGPLNVTSPNGGEVWAKGTTRNITWTAPAYFKATYADIRLIPDPYQPCAYGYGCPTLYKMPYTIATNISINQNSYSWNVGDVLPVSAYGYGIATGVTVAPEGKYTIQICETGTDNCDLGNGMFTIGPVTTTVVPDVNIVSPNGGQSFSTGNTMNISWRFDGVMKPEYQVKLTLTSATGVDTGFITTMSATGQTSYNWTVPKIIILGDIGKQLVSGNYKVHIDLYDGSICPPALFCSPSVSWGKVIAYDDSDVTFYLSAN